LHASPRRVGLRVDWLTDWLSSLNVILE
jgi:hypothetical protein